MSRNRTFSAVGQASGLPVHGSGSVVLVNLKHLAGGPVNRQVRDLPHAPA
jgi:hypothetical protein